MTIIAGYYGDDLAELHVEYDAFYVLERGEWKEPILYNMDYFVWCPLVSFLRTQNACAYHAYRFIGLSDFEAHNVYMRLDDIDQRLFVEGKWEDGLNGIITNYREWICQLT